jgi:predicted ABC-type transport system involved in lysophospholipase L1 biosynthesis ATPase subunit
MARSALKEREDYVLEGHGPTIPEAFASERFRTGIRNLVTRIDRYLGNGLVRHYSFVVGSGPPVGGERSAPGTGQLGTGQPAGAVIELANLVYRSGTGDAGGSAGAAGVSLRVPPGQSVALLGRPPGTTSGLLDVIAGLSRPVSGQVRVDGVAVDRLGGQELDHYRASRGLVSARFPPLRSLSVTDNVLAALLAGRVNESARERAARLLELTGAARLAGPVDRLPAEDQWRIMIARALVSSPRLVLAEDPTVILDPRAAGRVLDVLMDVHATFGFTLVLAADRVASAVRCQRQVSLVDGAVAEDEMPSGDDAWTRGRIDRIG